MEKETKKAGFWERFITNKTVGKWIKIINFIVLGFMVVDYLVVGNLPGGFGYLVASLWCFLYFEVVEMLDRCRVLLDGALDGWSHSNELMERMGKDIEDAMKILEKDNTKQP